MELQYFLGIDYPTWWFLVIGGLFTGYAILDGLDFGAGMWHLFFNKEHSRRIALNAVGPVWDGNEVWLVIGVGALFAGFPIVYATLLSSLYIPFMMFLFFIILRAISIEFRSKEEMLWWRQMWDVCYSVASFALAFILGIIMGNVLQGFPIKDTLDVTISISQAINPFTLMMGLMTSLLFMMHGGIYLLLKTEGKLFDKVRMLTNKAVIAYFVLFIAMSFYILIYLPHLSDRFKTSPVLFLVPLLGILSLANIPRLMQKEKYFRSFVFSSLSIGFFLMVVAIELYPVILMSSIDSQYSLDIYQTASSNKTLKILLQFVLVGAPLVLSYTIFVYRTFRGKVRLDDTSY